MSLMVSSVSLQTGMAMSLMVCGVSITVDKFGRVLDGM